MVRKTNQPTLSAIKLGPSNSTHLAKQQHQVNIVLEKQLVMMESQKDFEDNNICEEKKNNWIVPYLVMDIMSNIFMRLPARKLNKLRYSCKEWYTLISSSRFIMSYLHQSKPGLIAIPVDMTFPGVVGTRYVRPDIIQIKDKKVNIRSLRLKRRNFVESTCNGLVLLEDMVGNLICSNHVTGQMLTLPPCTQRSKSLDIKRGITLVDSTGEYKVVSVVIDHETGWLGCEMLALGSSTWKWVSSPLGRLFRGCLVEQKSISIKGVVHLMLSGSYEVDAEEESKYVISFDTIEEKFYKSEIPWFRSEALHEIDGCPSIVVPNCKFIFGQWDIFAMKDLSKGEWDKQCCINLTGFCNKFPRHWHWWSDLFVVATLENGRLLILERWHGAEVDYHIYDVQLQQLRSLELDTDTRYLLLPHVESLVPCSKP